jgi:two-component system sensor histidine kinase VicK
LVEERVVYVNAAYERILGGHRALVNEELPALLARLDPDDVPVFERLWRLWKSGGLHEDVEIRLRPSTQPEQPEQWFCLTPHQQQAADGHAWVGGVITDITPSKLYQHVSDKFQAKKNTVLEILAHDLAGAFVLMQQLTDYVQEELGPDGSPRVLDMLRIMQNTSRHSVQMIHDLMDQEFMESASIPLKRERVDLREKVAQSLEPFRRAPGREAWQLVFEAPPEPVYAEIDVTKLLQVVANLTANALKFTPDNGRITVRVEPGPGPRPRVHCGGRRGHWHPRAAAAPGVRPVHEGAAARRARGAHHRPGPVVVQNHRGAARRHLGHDQCGGPGQHVHGGAARRGRRGSVVNPAAQLPNVGIWGSCQYALG